MQNITITDEALHQILLLQTEADNASIQGLRIFVQGGGCSGFQYGFTFEETINEDDFTFYFSSKLQSSASVKVIIDALSLNYLQNAELDYHSDLNGAQFIIKNPNATTTCGCGSSFSA